MRVQFWCLHLLRPQRFLIFNQLIKGCPFIRILLSNKNSQNWMNNYMLQQKGRAFLTSIHKLKWAMGSMYQETHLIFHWQLTKYWTSWELKEEKSRLMTPIHPILTITWPSMTGQALIYNSSNPYTILHSRRSKLAEAFHHRIIRGPI